MNIWAQYPEQMARRIRQRDAIVEALTERGIDVKPYLGTKGAFFVRGRVTLSLGGLMDLWRRLFPDEILPTPKSSYRP